MHKVNYEEIWQNIMNKKILIFQLTNHAKILVQLNHPRDIIDAGYEAKFFLKNYNHQYFIAYNCVRSNIDDLQELLKKALKK